MFNALAEKIFSFFEIASGLTILLVVGSILLLIVCTVEIKLGKKVYKNVISIAVLLVVLFNGVRMFITSDLENYEVQQKIKSQIESKLSIKINKLKKIESHNSETKYQIYANFSVNETCQTRTVAINERYIGGLYGTRYTVTNVGMPSACVN